MGLALELDSLEGLDDSLKSIYQETDGKYRLDVDGIEDTSGLKRKNEELLAEKKAASEKARLLEEEKKKSEEDRAKEQGEYKNLFEKKEQELLDAKSAHEASMAKVRERDMERAALSLSTLSTDPKKVELLSIQAQRFTKFTDNGVVYVDENGDEISAEQAKAKLADNYPFLVDGSKANGGGAAGGNGRAVDKKFNEMTGAELSQLRANNPDEYKRLKDEFNNTGN